MDDLIETLLRGGFELKLPALTLIRGDGLRFEGSGRLRWKRGSPIRISARTDGGKALLDSFWRERIQLGSLLPATDYLSVEAEATEGLVLSGVHTPCSGYRISDRSPRVVWNLEPPRLTLSRLGRGEGADRTVRALLGPPPSRWPHLTVIGPQDSDSRGTSWKRDALRAAVVFGEMAARQRSDQWFEVIATMNRLPEAEGEAVLVAIRNAFSFMLGRRVSVLGYQEQLPDRVDCHIIATDQTSTKGHLLEPIGSGAAYYEHAESLVGRAVDFFLTDQGGKVAQDLALSWELVDCSLRAQHIVVCICLEALLGMMPNGTTDPERDRLESDRRKLLDWCQGNPDSLSPQFVNRIQGWAGQIHKRRAGDVLHGCRKLGPVRVHKADIDAWDRIRNSSVHGGRNALSMDGADVQANLDDLFRLVNLVNRFTLHLMGYKGRYKNYGQPHWPETDFPEPVGQET